LQSGRLRNISTSWTFLGLWLTAPLLSGQDYSNNIFGNNLALWMVPSYKVYDTCFNLAHRSVGVSLTNPTTALIFNGYCSWHCSMIGKITGFTASWVAY
jgi:hypothetical protein